MATTKKGTRSPSRKAAVASRPAVTIQRAPATVTTSVAVKAQPPLESSLDRFARMLRAELDEAHGAIEALRAELAALRKRHDQHTHPYSFTGPGNAWVEMPFLKHYFTHDDNKGYDGFGLYLRIGPVTAAAERPTGPPGG